MKSEEALKVCLDHVTKLDKEFYAHPTIGIIFNQNFERTEEESQKLANAYNKWLHGAVGMVKATRPMLQNSRANLLKSENEEDKKWANYFIDYDEEETDTEAEIGHEQWAIDDMKQIGDPGNLSATEYPQFIKDYHDYFVTRNHEHPYASLGAKMVLENLSIVNAPAFMKGLFASNIKGISETAPPPTSGVYFIRTHGGEEEGLDHEHTKVFNEQLRSELNDPEKIAQIIEGANFVEETYQKFLKWVGEP